MRAYLPEDIKEELSLLRFTRDILVPVAVGEGQLSPRERWLLGLRVDDVAVLLDDFLIEKIIEIANSPSSGVCFPFPVKRDYSAEELCWIRRWAVQHALENRFFEDYFLEFDALLHGDIVPARHRHAVDRCGAASVSPPWMFLPS